MKNAIFALVDEMLDNEGDVIITGLTFSRSAILKEMDPIAYRELCIDMADGLIQDLIDEKSCLDPVADFGEYCDIEDEIAELESI
jgi:hypothetical protein